MAISSSFNDSEANQLNLSPSPLRGRYVDLYKRTRVTVPPALEPVTLDELKMQLHIELSNTTDDTYLTSLIPAARAEVENYLRKKLITQTIEMTLDAWPFSSIPSWEGTVQTSRAQFNSRAAVKLWFPPLQSVTEVEVTLLDGTSEVYPSSNYLVDTSTVDDYGRIALKRDATTITNIQEINAVIITYVAGYGDNATDVPFLIRQAILQYAAWLYTNRGDCNDGKVSYQRGQTPLDVSGAAGMLSSFRIERLEN